MIRGWLGDGVDEVCLATADEQTAGRGRAGRRWIAPPGAALLLSLGFRPRWLPPERAWQLGAVTSLVMAEAAEGVAALAPGTLRLKWPNDLVVEASTPDDPAVELRKLGGVLGESSGLGSNDPQVVIGVGLDVDWPAEAFPPELATTMTSLHELAGRRPIATTEVIREFTVGIENAIERLRAGQFPVASWNARQVTTGRRVRLELAPGVASDVLALGVDERSGALLVADDDPGAGARSVLAADVHHVRLAAPEPTLAAATTAERV